MRYNGPNRETNKRKHVVEISLHYDVNAVKVRCINDANVS